MTTFQSARFTALPDSEAASSAQPQVRSNASFETPATDSNPTPCLPAAIGPDGVKLAATATCGCGSVKLAICNRPSRSVNQSVSMVRGSRLRSRCMIASSDSPMRRRCVTGSIPSMYASEVSTPGPHPSITRPSVMWSNCSTRSATINGWWYGSEVTPVPSLIRRVRSAAAAMKMNGSAISSRA